MEPTPQRDAPFQFVSADRDANPLVAGTEDGGHRGLVGESTQQIDVGNCGRVQRMRLEPSPTGEDARAGGQQG
jgi:hypothetical protein